MVRASTCAGLETPLVPSTLRPLSDLAHSLDARVSGVVLVFGSLPPHGRDLDLLAHPPERAAIITQLKGEGYVGRGAQWARFHDGLVTAVEVTPARAWELDAPALAALFADSEPIVGLAHIRRPAAHHDILITARRIARGSGDLDARRRQRLDEALARDPDAWVTAARWAPAWGAEQALVLTRLLYQGGEGIAHARVQARLEFARWALRRPAMRRTAWRRLVSSARRQSPAIIAFSGLDGAGKSSQAASLQLTLQALGINCNVVWPPAQNALFQLHPAVKRALRGGLQALGRHTPAPRVSPPSSNPEGEHYDEAYPMLPAQRPWVMHALATIVAVVQAWSFRRGARAGDTRPDVVIFDRYALDATVYVRHRWGQGDPLRWQRWLIRALSRQPLRAYLLEVGPQTAYARKQDFPLQNLRERADLYLEHYAALGVTRLDGERPRSDLGEQIAREVWELLVGRAARR